MKRASIICASLLWGLSAVASGDGSTAYNFLNISTSSHIYGLGGVNISLIDDDINVTDQKSPHFLGPEVEKQLGISYMRYIGDRTLPV